MIVMPFIAISLVSCSTAVCSVAIAMDGIGNRFLLPLSCSSLGGRFEVDVFDATTVTSSLSTSVTILINCMGSRENGDASL